MNSIAEAARHFLAVFTALAAVLLVLALAPHQVTWVVDAVTVAAGHVSNLVHGHPDWTVIWP